MDIKLRYMSNDDVQVSTFLPCQIALPRSQQLEWPGIVVTWSVDSATKQPGYFVVTHCSLDELGSAITMLADFVAALKERCDNFAELVETLRSYITSEVQ